MKKSKGESQRIYWQQWLSSGNKSSQASQGSNYTQGGCNYSRRELITSSAAIRINPDAAKARDVTQLLRDTLKLSSLENNSKDVLDSDSLVLVGTLYSLPKDYIQFEHESPPRPNNGNNSDDGSLPSSSSDPFHVIQTLKPDDNPLATRDKMMEYLRRTQEQAPSNSSNISPKVQWYFVPSTARNSSPSPIPSCIELDGYCTSLEDDDESSQEDDEEDRRLHGLSINGGNDADETDTKEGDAYYDLDLLLSRCPFVEEASSTENAEGCSIERRTKADDSKRQNKELRRYFQLCYVQASSSGYLLKQSRSDPHVWRRVFCTLTDDHLWYTTRVPYKTSSSPTFDHHGDDIPRMGKHHGRISLGRALLLEPNTEYTASPLYRVPHSFEVVNSRGTSHIFRAPTRVLQRQWIQALTTKIMESFENSLLDHAELIVADEAIARNRRFASIAVEPFYDDSSESDHISAPILAETSGNESMYLSLIQANVLRLGMDIAEYREMCRHVHALLPANHPIVARSSSGSNGYSSRRAATSSTNHEHSNGNGKHTAVPMDGTAVNQVQAAWDIATRLLDKATHVALEVQQYAHHQNPKQKLPQQMSLSHSLETHCKHIDYVLTGQRRPVRAASPTNTNGRTVDRHTPPPLDLFDFLLSELQALARTTK